MTWALAIVVKMSVLLGVGLVAASVRRHGSAALRHWVIAATISRVTTRS